jgi:hypothetical protein
VPIVALPGGWVSTREQRIGAADPARTCQTLRLAFSPDGWFVAVGSETVAAVDVLGAATLRRVLSPSVVGLAEAAALTERRSTTGTGMGWAAHVRL